MRLIILRDWLFQDRCLVGLKNKFLSVGVQIEAGRTLASALSNARCQQVILLGSQAVASLKLENASVYPLPPTCTTRGTTKSERRGCEERQKTRPDRKKAVSAFAETRVTRDWSAQEEQIC